MSNGTTTDTFRRVYGLTRLNRNNIHFQGQLFRFGTDGDIYVDATGLVIGRRGVSVASRPGWHAGAICGKYSKSTRRFFLAQSQNVGRVPLP